MIKIIWNIMIYLFLFILCHGLVVLESKINDEDSSVLLVLFSQIVSVFSCVIAAFFSGRYMCFHTSGAAVPITGQSLAVVLTSALAGPIIGGLAMFIHLLIKAFIPLGASQHSTHHKGKFDSEKTYLGVQGGYVIGFVLCAVVNGFLFEHFELLESEVNDHTGYSQAPVSASEVFVFKCFWFLCEACTISVLSQTLILFSEYIWLLPKMQARTIRAHYIDPFLPGLALKGLVASFVLLIFKGHIHHHSTRASVSA